MDRGDTFDRAISIFMKFQTLRTVEYLIEIALVPCSLGGQVTKKSREKNLLLVPSVCPREIRGLRERFVTVRLMEGRGSIVEVVHNGNKGGGIEIERETGRGKT